MSIQEISVLNHRVNVLEKALKRLAQWTKFDPEELKVLLGESKDLPRTQVARKSTSGRRRRKTSETVWPKLELVQHVSAVNDLGVNSWSPVKFENVEFASDYASDFDAFDYYFDKEVTADTKFDYNGYPENSTPRLMMNTAKTKEKTDDTTISWYRYKPLIVGDKPRVKDGPVVVMENISREELKKRNVKIISRWKRQLDSPTDNSHKPKFPCHVCNKVFNFRQDCVHHYTLTHPEVPPKVIPEFTCPHCGRKHNHKQKYMNHVRIHTQERPYLCYVCGQAFKTAGTLRMHIQLLHDDSPDRPFSCPVCNQAFKVKASLNCHLRKKHVPRISVMCDSPDCEAVFGEMNKLKRHKLEVHSTSDNRKFSCHLCGQMFKRKPHLKIHILRHANPNRRKRGPQKPLIKFPVKNTQLNDDCNNPGIVVDEVDDFPIQGIITEEIIIPDLTVSSSGLELVAPSHKKNVKSEDVVTKISVSPELSIVCSADADDSLNESSSNFKESHDQGEEMEHLGHESIETLEVDFSIVS